MYKFQTKNISNQFTNKVLYFLKHSDEYTFLFNIINIKSLQGKNKFLLKDLNIEIKTFEPAKEEKQLLFGYYNPSEIKIVLKINKHDIDNFRQKMNKNKLHISEINFNSLEYMRREILLFFEHELTHTLQSILIPKSINLTHYNSNDDYREIEAISNEILKLKNDYEIPLQIAIEHCLSKGYVDRKSILKKVYRKIL